MMMRSKDRQRSPWLWLHLDDEWIHLQLVQNVIHHRDALGIGNHWGGLARNVKVALVKLTKSPPGHRWLITPTSKQISCVPLSHSRARELVASLTDTRVQSDSASSDPLQPATSATRRKRPLPLQNSPPCIAKNRANGTYRIQRTPSEQLSSTIAAKDTSEITQAIIVKKKQ
jgi:hypothetical protein